MEEGDSKPRLLQTLSLFPEHSENIATKPPVDTSFLGNCTVNSPSPPSFFSCMMATIDDHDDERKPPTLSLFPESPENLSAYKKPNILGNTSSASSTTYPTFTALSPSQPYCTPNSYSTISRAPSNANIEPPDNNFSAITSQDSSTLAKKSQNLLHDGTPIIDAEPLRVVENNRPGTSNEGGHCAPKRSFHESIGPIKKKSRVRKELKNNTGRRLILQQDQDQDQDQEEHWITKKLTESDVNSASRLLLPTQEVMAYILPFLGDKKAIDCQTLTGTYVTVWDLDTQSAHNLKLNKWSTGSFQLINSWRMEFVKRRNLKIDDVIALRWDQNSSRFYFRVQ